ncbi:MAG TPA: glycosyltransferase 87 family protein [Candidatus Acidoferrales bacterium]|nr:glycosyltransferase 87 family protein [Candidatus Acidoferrales bacterium]
MMRRARISGGTIVLAGFVVLELLFLILYRFRDLEAHAIGTITIGLGAGIVYFIVLYGLEHRPGDSRANRTALWIIMIGAMLFRLTLLPLAPTLSDDPYRYHWDGDIQLAGYNPYIASPDTLPLGQHVTPLGHALPAHDMPNVYPPLAEMVFKTAARYLPGAIAFKLPFLFADLLAVFLLAGCLRSSTNRNFRLAIYAWNPLVIVEFAGTGHSDALALAALLAALLIIRSRIGVSTILLAAAALLKVFPATLFPLWLRRAGWPRTRVSWAAGIGSAALAAICFWPYHAALAQIPATLAYFSAHWLDNNASLFTLLRMFSGHAEVAAGIGEGIVVALAFWAAARRMQPERAAFLIFGAILLLSPNAYPWYFTWIIPLLCFFPNPAWLLLTILQFLSYSVLIGYGILGTWHWSPLMLWLEYAPFYGWMGWELVRANRTKMNVTAEA